MLEKCAGRGWFLKKIDGADIVCGSGVVLNMQKYVQTYGVRREKVAGRRRSPRQRRDRVGDSLKVFTAGGLLPCADGLADHLQKAAFGFFRLYDAKADERPAFDVDNSMPDDHPKWGRTVSSAWGRTAPACGRKGRQQTSFSRKGTPGTPPWSVVLRRWISKNGVQL